MAGSGGIRAGMVAALTLVGASSAFSAPPPPAHHGYALPSDLSPAADTLPRAHAPTRLGFNQELDLPEADDYSGEVLRYTSTGLGPTVVVQLAEVRPRQPVQVMLVKATGAAHLKEATRAYGQASWSEYLALRERALAAMLERPMPPAPAVEPAAAAGDGDFAVSSVGQVCTLEYAGFNLTLQRTLDCQSDGPLIDVRDAILATAPRAPAQ